MNEIVLTLDVDWAPDCAIDFVAEKLLSHHIRATWFITHPSPAIVRLKEYPHLFELGIHPNFLQGSTHGDSPEAVLDHSMSLVPNAMSMRSHALVQSTPLLDQVMLRTPITNDVSLFLPRLPNLGLVEYQRNGRTLLRVPYFWEDDFEMENHVPSWELGALLELGGGVKVFDFHPIHVYLNSASPEAYRQLKRQATRLADVTRDKTSRYVQKGEGTQKLFNQLIDHLAHVGKSARICDIGERWRAARSLNARRTNLP